MIIEKYNKSQIQKKKNMFTRIIKIESYDVNRKLLMEEIYYIQRVGREKENPFVFTHAGFPTD